MEYLPPSEDIQKAWKKRKRKRITFYVLAGIIIVIFGIMKYFYDPHLKQHVFTFSYGETIPISSSAYLTYGEQYEDETFDAELFAMKDIGEYEVHVIFAQKPYTLHIEIIDDVAPQITFAEKDKAYLYHYEDQVYLESLYSISDESDVQVEVTPTIDELQNGNQEICVYAVDAFDNKARACKTFYLETIAPQLVEIPDVASLEELVTLYMKSKNLNLNTFAFYYYSFDDEETYVYNGDKAMIAASIIKIPLNMALEDCYASGEMNREDSIVFWPSDVEAGEGDTIRDYKIGMKVPYAYLQKQSLENSDNTATNMLVRALGGFNKFRQLIAQYSDATLPNEFYTQNVITMNYMLDVMKELYDHQAHYQNVIDHMKKASVGDYLQQSSEVFEIAQKYGMLDPYFHVTGIVYTPMPYVVGIYTINRPDANTIMKELNEWIITYQFQKSVQNAQL